MTVDCVAVRLRDDARVVRWRVVVVVFGAIVRDETLVTVRARGGVVLCARFVVATRFVAARDDTVRATFGVVFRFVTFRVVVIVLGTAR